MRTAFKPRPDQALILPTKEALYRLIDELQITDYTGKTCVSKTEIKHIRLNYTCWDMNNINN
ncbi:MAG: hypothetical protein JWM14_2887 [Chitinophagaceae bacterium]|nr:hypothetical protein [Chitinophagaceae bacterium]